MDFLGKIRLRAAFITSRGKQYFPSGVREHMADTFTRSGVKDAIGENGIKGCQARRSGMM